MSMEIAEYVNDMAEKLKQLSQSISQIDNAIVNKYLGDSKIPELAEKMQSIFDYIIKIERENHILKENLIKFNDRVLVKNDILNAHHIAFFMHIKLMFDRLATQNGNYFNIQNSYDEINLISGEYSVDNILYSQADET